MKKKHLIYGKKTLSVFLAVMMLMSCWVFVAPEKAEAANVVSVPAVNGSSYVSSTYGIEQFDGNLDRWFKFHNQGSDYVQIYYPSHIYLDKAETLQSAGYFFNVNWHFGYSTNYRILIGANALGDNSAYTGYPDNYYTMTNNFDGYGFDASLPKGAPAGLYGKTGSATDFDLRIVGYGHDGQGSDGFSYQNVRHDKYVLFRSNNTCDPNTATIYLMGTPKGTFTGTYSTSGNSMASYGFQQNYSSGWKTNSNTMFHQKNYGAADDGCSSYYEGQWAEMKWDITVYDKAALNSACTVANTYYNNHSSYSSYAVGNTWSAFTSARNNANSTLINREETQSNIDTKSSALVTANSNLKFAASNTALKNKVAEAQGLQNKAGYATLYTAASKQALQVAIDTATSNAFYNATTEYSAAQSDAGAKAAADQTTINNLINGIDAAINGLVRRYDVGYDNLFSLTDWALNPVKSNMSNGTIEIDADKGTIKITHDGSSTGTDNNTSQGTAYYKAKVEGNTEYVMTWKTEGSGRGQIHVFYTTGDQWTYSVNANYNNGSHWFVNSGDLPYSANMGTHEVTFTTLPETDGLVFRFGTCNSGDSITFSDIRVVKKSVYDDYAKNYGKVREAFSVGDTSNLTLVPTREGYAFDAWVDGEGNTITSVAGLSASDTVYATWTALYKVEFKNYNGDVLKTEYVKPGTAATAPANDPVKDPDADYEYVFDGWDKDFSNVNSDLVVTAEFKGTEHTGIKYQRVSAATCTTPGKITKICTACNYAWNGGAAYEDTAGEFLPPLGHTFERATPTWTVVTGTSTGDTDDDLHTIKCNDCDATTTMKHDFKIDANHPAASGTCVKEGETYYKCACLEEKTIVGALNPDNHVNTEIRGYDPAECEKPGYTGDTWCNDCGEKIKDGTEIEALEHVYTNYVYDEGSATCTADGTKTAVCDNGCGKKDTITATDTMIPHSFTVYTSNNDAECEKDGTKTAKCDYGCGAEKTITDVGSALVHDYTGEAMDNGDGTHSFLCKNDCGTYGGTVACSSWKENAVDGKCECTVCGYTKDHAWGAWTTVGGSATEAATQIRVCTVCGAEDEADCKYEVTLHKDATCEAAEITTYQCSECGHGYTVIGEAAKGHYFTQAAGVMSYGDGQHAFLCANGCGEYGIDTTKNLRVACSEWLYANTETGKHTATCKACSYTKTENCSGGTATCTAKAECQFCGEAYGELADHSYTGTEKYLYKATEATCIANETYYYYCIGCEQTVDGIGTYEKPGTMTPHVYDCTDEYLYIATQAKCGVNETYYAYCSTPGCAKSSEDANNTFEKPDTALTHNWVNAQYNGEDTLTHTFTCSNTNTDGWSCPETTVGNCADAAIAYGYEPSTCTEQGYTTVQCAACNHTWNINYTEPLGHDYSKKIYTADYLKEAANCEHANIYWYSCSRCDKHGKDETDTEKYTTLTFLNGEVREHDWKNVVDAKYLADEATCFAAAKYYTSCGYADCGKSSEEVNGEGNGVKFSSGSPLAHDWKEVDDVKYLATKADCVNDATYYYECSLCKNSSKDYGDGKTWTKADSKTGHDFDHDNDGVIGNEGDAGYAAAKAATCYAAGNNEYWYCETCKKYFKDADATEAYLGQSETVIKKRDHDIEKVAFKAATCEEDGHPAYEYCKYEDCDYTTLPAVIPDGYKAIGHNFAGAYTYDEVHLYHSKLCLNGCGKSGLVVDGAQVEYKVDYEGVDYVISGGEKCTFTYKAETKDGVHSHANACVCGNNTTKTYSDEETFVETVAPTCTTDGYDSFACPDETCDATWKKNIVKTEGHKPGTTATSNGDGTHSYICTVDGCGYKVSTENCSGGTATCKDQAICEKCSAPYGETTDHTFTAEWVYQNDAQCGVNGTEKNTCDICNTEVTREAKGTALNHDMTEHGYTVPEKLADILAEKGIEIKVPTCKDEGLSLSYCTRCDNYVTKIQPKDSSAHIWETDENGELVWTVVSGDCSTGITKQNKCTVCGKVQTQTVDGEHEWDLAQYIAPTCIKNGYRKWQCTECDFIMEEYYGFDGELPEGYNNEDLKANGVHVYYTAVVTVPATCTSDEYTIETCMNCREEKITYTEGTMLEHTLYEVKAEAPDCDYAGHEAYEKCADCSYSTLTDEMIIPALGHADNDGNGKCDECNDVLYDTDDGQGSCGCICHKESWFMRIIYKILNFFWKLFKISKTCNCGNVHW